MQTPVDIYGSFIALVRLIDGFQLCTRCTSLAQLKERQMGINGRKVATVQKTRRQTFKRKRIHDVGGHSAGHTQA